jgi:hypothetical protein
VQSCWGSGSFLLFALEFNKNETAGLRLLHYHGIYEERNELGLVLCFPRSREGILVEKRGCEMK